MRVLVTRPKYDGATHYLYYWTGKVIDWVKNRTVEIIDLKQDKSNKKNVCGYLKKNQAGVVLLNGHGNEEAIFGHGGKELFSVKDDLSFFNGKTVFMRACRAGKVLGTQMVKAGARAVIGYDEDFQFWHLEDYLHSPLDDPLARPYMEASNQVSVSLLKGHAAATAQENSMKRYRKEIAKMLNSESA